MNEEILMSLYNILDKSNNIMDGYVLYIKKISKINTSNPYYYDFINIGFLIKLKYKENTNINEIGLFTDKLILFSKKFNIGIKLLPVDNLSKWCGGYETLFYIVDRL